MNKIMLRDFTPETLLLVSRLIDRRTIKIRETPPFGRTKEQNEELENLLQFQTQILYSRQLVLSEQKILQS
jgi:hypothetical protein